MFTAVKYIHDVSLGLTPSKSIPSIRSFRLGGNRVAGELTITSLLLFPSLCLFNVDTAVTPRADGYPSLERSSKALRRLIEDIKFNKTETVMNPPFPLSYNPGAGGTRPSKRVTIPLGSPKPKLQNTSRSKPSPPASHRSIKSPPRTTAHLFREQARSSVVDTSPPLPHASNPSI